RRGGALLHDDARSAEARQPHDHQRHSRRARGPRGTSRGTDLDRGRQMSDVRAASAAVVLASGGLDSTVLIAHYLASGWNVWPLFVDYGQRTWQDEARAVGSVLAQLSARLPGLCPLWRMR